MSNAWNAQEANNAAKATKTAKKLRFYRNGDVFSDGLLFAVGDRFRTFEALLAALTTSTLCDKRVLPKGVRFVFTIDGRKVTSLDELRDGEAYVVASVDAFKKLDYAKAAAPSWNPSVRGAALNKRLDGPVKKRDSDEPDALSREIVDLASQKGHVLVVIRNGVKPRKIAKVLLNGRTAHSFEQVLDMIGMSFKMPPVKKLYTLDRKQVTSLAALMQTDSTILAYGSELKSDADFILTDFEMQALRSVSNVAISPAYVEGARKNSNPDCRRSSQSNTARCSSAPSTPRQNRRNGSNGNGNGNEIPQGADDANGFSSGKQLSLFGSGNVNANGKSVKNGSFAASTELLRGNDELF